MAKLVQNNVPELDAEYTAGTYNRFPVTIVTGKGSLAYDEECNEYIDLESGYGTNLFGYCDEAWMDAVITQLHKVQHTSNLYYTEPYAVLGKLIAEKSGLKKTFFANSGGEANECALKAARKYGTTKHGKDCYKIITLNNSFHGRSFGAVTATGVDHYHDQFGPMVPGFLYTDINNSEALIELVEANKGTIAAIMLEFVQGEGGCNPVSQEFIDTVKKICQEDDILLIADEVQAGNGRTGKMYAYQHYDVLPDIMTTAKGLGAGLPIGTCSFGEKTAGTLVPGDHGSTFGGNPVSCAGAINVMERLNDNFFKEVQAKEAYIRQELENAPGVKGIDGMGLILGIIPEKGEASAIVAECLKNGVLCITTGGNKVRLLPPLNIPQELLEKAVAVIRAAFQKLAV